MVCIFVDHVRNLFTFWHIFAQHVWRACFTVDLSLLPFFTPHTIPLCFYIYRHLFLNVYNISILPPAKVHAHKQFLHMNLWRCKYSRQVNIVACYLLLSEWTKQITGREKNCTHTNNFIHLFKAFNLSLSISLFSTVTFYQSGKKVCNYKSHILHLL